jgi:hypothetical protein
VEHVLLQLALLLLPGLLGLGWWGLLLQSQVLGLLLKGLLLGALWAGPQQVLLGLQ